MIGERSERAQAVVSSGLVRSFEQLVKDTSAAVPDVPAVLLRVELPRLGLVWDGAAKPGGPGAPGAGTRGGSLCIASNTKTFVAATLIAFSERGRLELDAPAARRMLPSTVDAMGDAGLDLQRPAFITVG